MNGSMDFFPSLCLARMHFQGIVGNYDRNSWQSRNWRERDGLCLTKEGGWICRKQTGTPVINSRNQRYMAHPSITTAKERCGRFCYILLQRYAANPSINTLLCCSATNVFSSICRCYRTYTHTLTSLAWLTVEN